MYNLHGQFSGFHFFIERLNASNDSFPFIFEGIMFHTFGPRKNRFQFHCKQNSLMTC